MQIYGLDPFLYFAGIGTFAGALRITLWGNGSTRKAVGGVLAGMMLAGLFGTVVYKIMLNGSQTWSYLAAECGIAAAIIMALIAVQSMNKLIDTGTKSLDPLSDGVIRLAQWMGRRIGGEPVPPPILPKPDEPEDGTRGAMPDDTKLREGK